MFSVKESATTDSKKPTADVFMNYFNDFGKTLRNSLRRKKKTKCGNKKIAKNSESDPNNTSDEKVQEVMPEKETIVEDSIEKEAVQEDPVVEEKAENEVVDKETVSEENVEVEAVTNEEKENDETEKNE